MGLLGSSDGASTSNGAAAPLEVTQQVIQQATAEETPAITCESTRVQPQAALDSNAAFAHVERVLGFEFSDRTWLERALTHRSLQQMNTGKSDYERLEFLGDAVLDLAVADLLLEQYPQAREGDLSKMRAALVNAAVLADIARALDLGPCIRLSKAELASGGSQRSSILADVIEALIGAIYRLAGFSAAFEVVRRMFAERLTAVNPQDPKTELQEQLHQTGTEAPQYLLECVEGPEHEPLFVSVVKIKGQIAGRGRGRTKKASQQSAAEEALKMLRAEPVSE
jgi:ribonuclease-3